jgi:hypothetical protein
MASLNDNLFTRFVDYAGSQQFGYDPQIQWCALGVYIEGIVIKCFFFKGSTGPTASVASACRRYLYIAYQPLKRCLQISSISLKALTLNSPPRICYWKYHPAQVTYKECAACIS